MEDSTISMNIEPNDQQGNSFMPNSMNMEFEPLHEGPAKIKVIGVGGGGGNAVNHMYRQGIHGVEFIVCNTDKKALDASPVPNKITLGKLGAGNVPEHAREMALKHKDEIRDAISNDTQMLFITAGMGGGTGTGAAPIIAEIAKSIELDDDMVNRILVVAIVTEPFSFEGSKRKKQAIEGIEELRKHVDAILVINNDKLRKLGNLTLKEAFTQADDVLLTAAKGIAEIITVSAYVNIDFRDANTVMEKSGTALMGAGEGRGENRARQAIEAATTSVLLNDNDISGAKNILLYFSCSPDHQITMDELAEVTDYLTERTGGNSANVIWGIGDDENLNDELRITLIATGFEPLPGPRFHELPDINNTKEKENIETVEEQPKAEDIHEAPVDEFGTHIVHKATPVVITAEQVQPSNATEPAAPVTKTPLFDNPEPIKKEEKIDNPFDSMQSHEINGKRYIPLEAIDESAIEDVDEEKVEDKQEINGNSHLDEIRVISRAATMQAATAKVSEPVFQIEATEAFEDHHEEKVITIQTPVFDEPAKPIAKTTPVDSYVTEPINRPNVAEQAEKMMKGNSIGEDEMAKRMERIRRMNDLLHNDPNGPNKIEQLTTEDLTGEVLYHTPNSAESDAARTRLSSDGFVSQGMNLFNDLPD